MGTTVHVEELDVLIIGAGISGIGAGRYLRTEHPTKTFAILEGRGATGGTWDLFRYPGIRSDADLHTFGYGFKPWKAREAIAEAPQILEYLNEAVEENGLSAHIRLHHKVLTADWDSACARWMVEVERTEGEVSERVTIAARWIFSASGYYRYDEGYTPHFEGRDRFQGTIVHPQHWPEDLDYTGKRVVVIGSGATAVTLVPAMAGTAGHVTMLQRTPSYIISIPQVDTLALVFMRLLGEQRGFALTRRKNLALQRLIINFCRKYPNAARRWIRRMNAKLLPAGYPVDEHFNPPYKPWDQRLCMAPDGDLFASLSSGDASMVTDKIVTFTETGILLESGQELEADIIVTATGLNIQMLGGISVSVDGQPVIPSERVMHRGMMLSGVPNFAVAIGYTTQPWTLKIGLLCEYFCSMLTHLDDHGYDAVWPEAPAALSTRPLLDFGAGYVQRSIDRLPKQGPDAPWVMSTTYDDDRDILRAGNVADEALRFGSIATATIRPSASAETRQKSPA